MTLGKNEHKILKKCILTSNALWLVQTNKIVWNRKQEPSKLKKERSNNPNIYVVLFCTRLGMCSFHER